MGNKQAKIDPKEEAKKNKRTIDKAVRQIERERKKLEALEPKLLKDIKAMAQKNQHVSNREAEACNTDCHNYVCVCV